MSQRPFSSIATPAARAAEATVVPVSFTIPPPITSDARTSLVRLPLPSNAKIRWWKFTINDKLRTGTAQVVALQRALESILQTAKDEISATGYEQDTLTSRDLMRYTLWSSESRESSAPDNAISEEVEGSNDNVQPQVHGFRSTLRSLWLFKCYPAELSTMPSSLSSHLVGILAQAQLATLEGQCSLDQFYEKNGWRKSTHSTVSVLPRDDRRAVLRQFQRALEEHYLLRWTESSGKSSIEQAAPRSDTGQSAPSIYREVVAVQDRDAPSHTHKSGADVDDEEEGALDDEGQGETKDAQTPLDHSASMKEYWSTCLPKQTVLRFGSGVAVFDARTHRSPFERRGLHRPLHMSLRCFLDHQGYAYLETWAYAPQASHFLSTADEVMPGQGLMLCPLASYAKCVRHIGALHYDRLSEEDERESKLKSLHESLISMLRLRGVDVSTLQDDWTLCSKDEQEFLWPTQLCLLSTFSSSNNERVKSPSLFTSTLSDVTARVRNLVRETLYPNADLTFDVHEDEGFHLPDGGARDEDEEDDMNVEDDEVVDGENGDARSEASLVDGGKEREEKDPVDGGRRNSGQEVHKSQTVTVDSEKDAEMGEVNRVDPTSAAPTAKEEEMDLWGTFGFTDQDDTHIDAPPRSRDGFDDGGFGLVTEDDFSFFDDAAFAAFPDDGDVEEDAIMTDVADIADDKVPVQPEVGSSLLSSVASSYQILPAAQARQSDNDTSSSSVAHSMPVDPPSLPGFTPGSLSASSPAVGGMSVKTPRTPYSPSQDLADATITIEGEHGPLDHHLYSTGGTPQYMHPHASAGIHGGMPAPFDAGMNHPDSRLSHPMKDRQHQWMMRNRRDITSKYEQGKFAMPLVPVRSAKKQADEENVEERGRHGQSSFPSRNRLASRNGHSHHHHSRRLSLSRQGQQVHHPTLQQKNRLGMLRAEDEASEATLDGTMSDRSSLMDDESDDDDESVSSNDQSEMSSVLLQQRSAYLSVARSMLYHVSPSTLSNDDAEELKQNDDESVDWREEVGQLIDNPQLRQQIVRHARSTRTDLTISRRQTQNLFALMRGLEDKTTFSDVFTLPNASSERASTSGKSVFEVIEPCNIVVGCQSSVVSLASTALSFWDKLNLSAVSGPKQVTAFAIHVGHIGMAMQRQVQTWLEAMEHTFQSCGFGSHTMANDGLLGVGGARVKSMAHFLAGISSDAEQWSDTLDSLFSRLKSLLRAHKSVVIYVVGTPVEPLPPVWAFARLERDLRNLAVARLHVAKELIIVRPCPWQHICPANAMSRQPISDIRRVAASVYDQLQAAVVVQYNAESHLPRFSVPPTAVRFPSFTISSSPLTTLFCDNEEQHGHSAFSRTTPFSLDWNARSFNFLNRGSLLHVGFHPARRRGMTTFVALVDEFSQGYTADAWRRTGTAEDDIRRIWNVVVEYSLRARMQWRIVLCKDSPLSSGEVKRWSALLSDMNVCKEVYAADVTLTCVETERPLALVLPLSGRAGEGEMARRSPTDLLSSSKPSARYVDATRTKYAIYPQTRLSLSSVSSELDPDDDSPILPLCSSLTITVPHAWNSETALASAACNDEEEKDDSLHENGVPIWPDHVPHQLWLHIVQVFPILPDPLTDEISGHRNNNSSAPTLEARLARITKNFQALELIARERAMLTAEECAVHLPWHLAIVRALRTIAPIVFRRRETGDKSTTS